jgi:beta-lactamase regulating signal transducer with metallopeptidase domain/HEAT repeat protein
VTVDAQWLVLLLLKSTVLLLAGAAAVAVLRAASAGTRHRVWLATLAGVVALPILGAGPVRIPVPTWTVGLSAVPVPAALDHESRHAAAASDGEAAIAAIPAPPTGPATSGPTWSFDVSPITLLLELWAAVSAMLLAGLLVATLAARRLVRTARPLDDPHWTRLLLELSDRLDLADPPALLESGRAAVPFAYGVLRPAIVLPPGAEKWSEERKSVVLLHELAHIRRRDLLSHRLSGVACAVYWFHPLVWMAARRLRAESEKACDDFVLRCGTRPSDYAGHLLDLLSHVRVQAPGPALPITRTKEFEGRLLAILDPARRRSAWRAEAALLGALGLVFVTVAIATPVRVASAQADAAPSASATPAAVPKTAGPAPLAVAPAPASVEAPRSAARTREARRAAQPPQAEPPPQPASGAQRPLPTVPRPADADEKTERSPDLDRDRQGLLMRVLRSDSDASVRRSAAWGLADNARGDAVGVLVAALRGDDDAGVREMAAWALVHTRNPDAAAALSLALLHDASAEVRTTAAWALGHHGEADMQALLAGVRDRDPAVREAAIWSLGQKHLDTAPPEVIAALKDGEARVRVVAAWTLGQILDPGSASAIEAAFTKEQDSAAAQALFRALVFLGERSPELLHRALGSKDPEVRARAARMLSGMGPGVWVWPWPWPQPRPMP